MEGQISADASPVCARCSRPRLNNYGRYVIVLGNGMRDH